MADIAELIVALRLQDGVSSGLGRLNGQLRTMDSGFAQVGRGVNQLGRGLDTLATRAGIAAAGLGTAFITTASSMEEAFVGVQKTVDETADISFEELRQSLRQLSSDTGTAFEELSRIGEVGGALGVPIDQLENFIDVVNRLAVSTDLSADQASTALGQLRTVLGLNNEELTGLADTLVALGNAGASTESQIVDLAARFAVAGNRAGLSTEEILALSSAVASMGIEVEAGGTALSNTFNQIAVAIGTGGAEVEAFTNRLGISAEEFRRRWETDALGVFQEWLAVVSQLPPIEQAVAFEQAGITGARQQAAIGALADQYGFVADQLEVARDATGALGEESDKFFGTSAAGFRRLRENLRLAADTIGTELLPVANELITEFVDFLTEPSTQAGLKEFGQNLAGGIRDFVAEIRKADFGPLLDTLRGAAAVAKAGFDAFTALPSGVQSLALAAFGINKLTGGALGGIASGLGNIIGGGIKILFERGASPANPLWVQTVGGPLGGGPAGTGGGLGGLVLGVSAAAITVALAETFEEEIDGLAESLHDSIGFPDLPGPEDWQWPLGSKNAPAWATETPKSPLFNPDASLWDFDFDAAFSRVLAQLPAPLGTPGGTRNPGEIMTQVVLPDTAMLPTISAIEQVRDAILGKGINGLRKGPEQGGNFVPDVRLDPSQVIDLREPTRIAAERLRLIEARFGRMSDQQAQQIGELVRNRSDAASRLNSIAAKQDGTNATLGGVNSRLNTANFHLGNIAGKNFTPHVKTDVYVTNNLSVNEWQRTVYSSTRATTPTSPTLL